MIFPKVGYGLICYKHKRAREGFLCNPLRGEVLKLPLSKLDGKKYIYMKIYRYGLGFDLIVQPIRIKLLDSSIFHLFIFTPWVHLQNHGEGSPQFLPQVL